MRRPRPSQAWQLLIHLGALVISSRGAAALSSNPAETLRTLVLSSPWSPVFHMLVFFTIFLGIIVRPLKDKFGRPGTAVAVAFALSFSAALALTGRLYIPNLEPIAGVALFALLGAVVGAAFKHFYETSWATATAVSFVVGYGVMSVAAPSLLPTTTDLFLIPEILYALAIVWLVYSFATHAFPNGSAAGSWFVRALRIMAARPPGARRRLQESAEEQSVFAEAAGQDAQEHVAMLAELEEAERAVRAYGMSKPEMRTAIANRLAALADAQRQVEIAYERYRVLAQRITELDVVEYADLQHDFEHLPEDIQREARAALGSLNEKLTTDRVLTNLGQAVEANNIAVRDALLHAQAALAAGRMKACLEALDGAKNSEREAIRLTAQIQRFAEQLKKAAASVLAQAMTRAVEAVGTR